MGFWIYVFGVVFILTSYAVIIYFLYIHTAPAATPRGVPPAPIQDSQSIYAVIFFKFYVKIYPLIYCMNHFFILYKLIMLLLSS